MKARNNYEIELMRKSGKIAASALKKALNASIAGAVEVDIDKIAEKEIYALGGDLSYKTVPGYKWATCITVNEEVVHGIPTSRALKPGDLISIDLAVMYKGWHTDTAWTILVESSELGVPSEELEEKERFLKVGEEALWDGIGKAIDGNRVGDISEAIQKRVEGGGYHIVKSLMGHGVGKSLHEEPEVPGYGKAGTGPFLKTGMTLAIEVIYSKGTSDVILAKDNWTYVSADGSWGGLFEMSVVVGRNEAEVLTNIKD